MKSPMDLLKEFAPEFAQNQMDERALIFEHPNYQAVPAKYKLLIGIAAAAISGSDTCTQMWVKMAKDQGGHERRNHRGDHGGPVHEAGHGQRHGQQCAAPAITRQVRLMK